MGGADVNHRQRVEPLTISGLAGESLFDALPQKLIRRILSLNHSSFPVLAGDKEKAIIALKFEPSDIVSAAPIWWACVFQVVSDGLRFQIQRVGAVIREVIVEGSRLLFASTGRGPVNEGLANALNIDLDSHPAGPIVGDDARWVIISKVKSGVCAFHRNQSPGTYQLLANIFRSRFSGEQENARKDQQDYGAFAHRRLVYPGQDSLFDAESPD